MSTVRITGLDGGSVAVTQQALATLETKLEAPLLCPSDAGFADATKIWNGMVTNRPAVVVQPVSAAEVSEAVSFARAHGLLISIKGGGHNVGGTSLADGGVTLDMSRLRWVEVDPRRRVAHVGPGCRLGDVDRGTQAHGLATVLGFISLTGVAGLTLGGGFGYLSRQFGWTADNLDEVEIVTADGQICRAASDEHEGLFWALRGGGGNFGADGSVRPTARTSTGWPGRRPSTTRAISSASTATFVPPPGRASHRTWTAEASRLGVARRRQAFSEIRPA
jgi:FAD binding domain